MPGSFSTIGRITSRGEVPNWLLAIGSREQLFQWNHGSMPYPLDPWVHSPAHHQVIKATRPRPTGQACHHGSGEGQARRRHKPGPHRATGACRASWHVRRIQVISRAGKFHFWGKSGHLVVLAAVAPLIGDGLVREREGARFPQLWNLAGPDAGGSISVLGPLRSLPFTSRRHSSSCWSG